MEHKRTRVIGYMFLIVFMVINTTGAYSKVKGRVGGGLQHVRGINSIQVRGGTGWGNTFDVGIGYQYYFHKNFSFIVNADYEQGKFKENSGEGHKAKYIGIVLLPGIEGCFFHPCNFLYLHFSAGCLMGNERWQDRGYEHKRVSGLSLGVYGGFNIEFFCVTHFSIVLSAEQRWRYSWLKSEGKRNYFSPLFSINFKYHI